MVANQNFTGALIAPFFVPKILPASKTLVESKSILCYNRVVKANDKEKNYVLFTTKGGMFRRADNGGIYAFRRADNGGIYAFWREGA